MKQFESFVIYAEEFMCTGLEPKRDHVLEIIKCCRSRCDNLLRNL